MPHTNIKVLTWFNFFTDFKFYAPVAIIYFTRVSGSFTLGMSIFAITMISSALFEIPTGIFSDYLGRRKTMLLGAVSAVLYALLYAISHSYWMLAYGALFEGLSRSFYSGTDTALLHESLAETGNEHSYDEYLGRVRSMFQIALAISAIIGSFLAQWSFPLIMWLSVIPQLLCVFLALRLREPRFKERTSGNIYTHLRKAYRNFIHNKKLRLLSTASILSEGMGEATYQFQSAFYNTVLPIWAIGIVKTLSNIGATISFRLSGRIIKKYGATKLLFTGTLYNRFINSIAVLFPTVLSPFLMVTSSFFYGITSVAENTLMQREFRSSQRATMGSLNSFGGSLFFGFAALLLGFIADRVSPARAILGIQLVSLTIPWLYWKLYNHTKAVTVGK